MNKQELDTLRRQIINKVIGIEGAYVNDKADSGGATKYGITHTTARKHGISDVSQITVEQAYRIYELDYWHDINADELARRSSGLAYELFDTAVNMGEARAGGFLQRVLNVLNLNGQFYPDVLVDHDIGPKTLAALDAFIARRGQAGLRMLVRMLDDLQSAFFIELAERRQKDERFIYGWQSHRVGVAFMPKDPDLLPKDKPMKPEKIDFSHSPGQMAPPEGFVQTTAGEQIPYWPGDAQRFEQDSNTAFGLWLQNRAERLRQQNSKPSWKSKIIWGGAGIAATGASLLATRIGLNVDPDTLLNAATVVMMGGGSFVAVARKWFTKKFLR